MTYTWIQCGGHFLIPKVEANEQCWLCEAKPQKRAFSKKKTISSVLNIYIMKYYKL